MLVLWGLRHCGQANARAFAASTELLASTVQGRVRLGHSCPFWMVATRCSESFCTKLLFFGKVFCSGGRGQNRSFSSFEVTAGRPRRLFSLVPSADRKAALWKGGQQVPEGCINPQSKARPPAAPATRAGLRLALIMASVANGPAEIRGIARHRVLFERGLFPSSWCPRCCQGEEHSKAQTHWV